MQSQSMFGTSLGGSSLASLPTAACLSDIAREAQGSGVQNRPGSSESPLLSGCELRWIGTISSVPMRCYSSSPITHCTSRVGGDLAVSSVTLLVQSRGRRLIKSLPGDGNRRAIRRNHRQLRHVARRPLISTTILLAVLADPDTLTHIARLESQPSNVGDVKNGGEEKNNARRPISAKTYL